MFNNKLLLSRLFGTSMEQLDQLNKDKFIYVAELKKYFKICCLNVMDLKALMMAIKAGNASCFGTYYCPFCPAISYKRGQKSISSGNINKCQNNCRRLNRVCHCFAIINSEIIEKYCSPTLEERIRSSFVKFPVKTDKKSDWEKFAVVFYIYLYI